MPETTTQAMIAPRPRDPRVLRLAKTLNSSRSDVYTAVCDVWEALSLEADDDGLVKGWTPDGLDALVDTLGDGCGRAMVEAGLVGVVDDGLVLPSVLRRQPDHVVRRQAVGDADALHERERAAARRRQRRHRALKREQPTSTVASADIVQDRTPRGIGEVDGYTVMLLYRKDGVPFYKLAGATPKEWTGSVRDPERPTLADAYQAIYATMRRELSGKSSSSASAARPTPEAVLGAAERYQRERAVAAEEEARLAEGNLALEEAASDSLTDLEERDCHAPVTPVTRDTVTVTEMSRPVGVTCPPNSRSEAALQSVTCHAPVTRDSPSSSSLSGELSKDTTTTRYVTPVRRDAEDDILDRMLTRGRPTHELQDKVRRRREWAERCGRVLGLTAEDVIQRVRQAGPVRDELLRQLLEAGLDPNTGLPSIGRGTSVVESAGISLPDLRLDRPRPVVPDDDHGGDDVDAAVHADDPLVRQAS